MQINEKIKEGGVFVELRVLNLSTIILYNYYPTSPVQAHTIPGFQRWLQAVANVDPSRDKLDKHDISSGP